MINLTKLLPVKILFLYVVLFFLPNTNVMAQVQPTFNLNQGPTLLLNGVADKQIGAKYIYQDVEMSADGIIIDAIVTIVDKVNLEEPFAASFLIDSTLGVDDRFEPTVNTGPGDGYVEWKMEFVLDGTVTDATDVGVRARLEFFQFDAIDVDGEEFFEAIVTGSYTLEGGTTPPTELVVSQNGIWTKFQSGVNFIPEINAANTEYIVRLNYTNVSEVNFRTGSSNDSGNRQNSLSFLSEVTFDVETTTLINDPPEVVDNLGNIVNVDTPFNVNVLVGASDPNNNIDVTTVRLTDPNNPANQGTVGNPLVIAGVGTYTVDNAGNVLYTPAPGYIGDASIEFTVEDDIGASSDQGNLQITVVDPCTNGATAGVVTANDPDADGINNVCDTDDDNDGILDVYEQGCQVFNYNLSADNTYNSLSDFNTVDMALSPVANAYVRITDFDQSTNGDYGEDYTITFFNGATEVPFEVEVQGANIQRNVNRFFAFQGGNTSNSPDAILQLRAPTVIDRVVIEIRSAAFLGGC